MKKRYFIPVFTVLFVLNLIAAHAGRNISESVPFKWFFFNRFEKPEYGDYVMFKSQRDPKGIIPEGVPLVKRIACSGGMFIQVDDEGFKCDGKLISERTDPDNMTMYYEGIIPQGMFFAAGDHPRSYDSRLWGLINEEDIIGVVHPLF